MKYLYLTQTVESLYILWKTTGDTKWRDWGWEIFEAIERVTKTRTGYAFVRHVDKMPPPLGDAMPR
jgi:mannosyl-oligosaccharide alpha-1,2-mannosidase